MNREVVDHADPRSAMEAAEAAAADPGAASSTDALRRVLAWILEGKNLAAVGTRVYVAAYVVAPEAIEGMTCHAIAQMSGQGRSSVNNDVREFEEIFAIRSVFARSEEARRHYSRAYHARNGTRPHGYNPRKGQ